MPELASKVSLNSLINQVPNTNDANDRGDEPTSLMKANPTGNSPVLNISEQDMEDPDMETEVVN